MFASTQSKTKLVTSGVNLQGLSSGQLEALIIEAKVKVLEQKEKEGKASVAALKASGELSSYKKEFAALGKEGKKLSRRATFELVLPIQFTVLSSIDEGFNLFDYEVDELTEDDLFNHSFSAKLTKDHNLNKKQAATLNVVIADYAENACNDIFDVIPEELISHYDAYAEKVRTFLVKAKMAGLSLKDLT